MPGFLLDTNVISELMKPRPSRNVIAWTDETPEALMHLSVITIGEVRKGIDLLRDDDVHERVMAHEPEPIRPIDRAAQQRAGGGRRRHL